jgi:hypothetical protein
MFALALVESYLIYLGSVKPEATSFFHSWFVSLLSRRGEDTKIVLCSTSQGHLGLSFETKNK